jgi:threonine dehydratase
MAHGAAMYESLNAGRPVVVEEQETLADSLGGGIGLANRYTFAMCRDLLDDVVLLSEEEIAAGIRHAAIEEGEIVEGAGAVGIAALLAGKIAPRGPTVVVVSGRNIDEARHRQIVLGAAEKAGSAGGRN